MGTAAALASIALALALACAVGSCLLSRDREPS